MHACLNTNTTTETSLTIMGIYKYVPSRLGQFDHLQRLIGTTSVLYFSYEGRQGTTMVKFLFLSFGNRAAFSLQKEHDNITIDKKAE